MAGALAGVLVAAAACGGGQEGTKARREAAELTLWTWASSPAEQNNLSQIIDKYNKLGKAIVKLQTIPEYDSMLDTALAGNNPPDLFYLNDHKLGDYAKAEKIVAYGDRLDNPQDFYPSLRDSFTYQGTFYCAPKDFSTLQLVYDVDAFKAAGLERPPTTWRELAAYAERLTKPGRPGFVNNADFYRWGVFMLQAGAWPTNEARTRMTMDTPEMRAALRYVADGLRGKYFAMASTVGASWGGEALGKHKAAMTIEGNWISGAMATDYPSVHWAAAELPAGPKGKGTLAFSVCFGLTKASKHQAEAIDFVKYVTAAEQQVQYTNFGPMPSRRSAAAQWLSANPLLRSFVGGAENAHTSVFVPGFDPVKGTIDDGLARLARGQKTVDEVIAATQQAGAGAFGG
ncbi:extracellular solute-binding protein [Krasilnikovia sp. MM14-A1004]|uniref:extracellular solute-binding protein n=1 Tax=Krasilnikovia sp. MM14-A1004 TaxID=3373541 RepID=UPI00399C9175